MAIPLLFIAPALAGGLYGLYKTGKGISDHISADAEKSSASDLIAKATSHVEERRAETQAALVNYGHRKLRTFNGPVEDFIHIFGRLKNVELVNSPGLEELQPSETPMQSLAGLRKDYQLLMDSGMGLGAGFGSGAALAFGAYNGTMLLASASTGTAISTLSGVAATNATLAWLGGGAISAGGGGIAMGTMVLGSLVAGPALAIFGFIVGKKAETALANARANKQVAKTQWEDAKLAGARLLAIQGVANLANGTFSKITSNLRKSVQDLKSTIDAHGEDFSTYSQESREVVFRAVKFAQLIKAMIDTPILDENGNLVLSTQKRVREIVRQVDGAAPEEKEERVSIQGNRF